MEKVERPPGSRKSARFHVLLAEDDVEMRRLLTAALRGEGYEVTEVAHGIELLNRIDGFLFHSETDHFDLIVADICMPGVTGLSILEGFHRCEGFPPMILITAFGDSQTHESARVHGVAAFLDKPFEIGDFLQTARRVLADPHTAAS